MTGEVFYWVLNMSISGAVMGLVVLLLRQVRQIPRRILYLLWAVPFLRMVIPVGVNSPFSLFSLLRAYTVRTVSVLDEMPYVTMMNFVQGADSYFPIEYKVDILAPVMYWAGLVWLVVGMALLLAVVMVGVVTHLELRDARHLEGRVWLSDKVPCPAVYGLFRQRIIQPRLYPPEEQHWIGRHESAHIRRMDNLRRTIALGICCVHWFNPLAWIFLRFFLEDLELACDEAVLDRCSEEDRRAYARVLVDHAERQSLYASAFGGAKVRVRIPRILAYRRLSLLSMTAFGALAAAVAYVLLTNPR